MLAILLLSCLSLAQALPDARRDTHKLIVGGKDAPVGSRPYQVALFQDAEGQSQSCGGTLVHSRWVVSAAHCVRGNKHVYVGLGYHNLDDKGKQIIRGEWIPRTDFDNDLDNDMALIHLDFAAAIISKSVEPIAIASSGSDVAPGTALLISGWGALSSNGNFPNTLQQVVVTAVDRAQCANAYKPAVITGNMFCAAAPGKDSCQNDSGGPIVSNFNEFGYKSGVILEGVISWGYGCADPKYPGVYARVANYCPWIAAKTNYEVTC